jgi:hypothetical protein
MITQDWSDTDVAAFLDFCTATEIVDESVPIRVWANESDNRTTAHNPGGDASGIFQLMPATAKGIGYNVASDPKLAAYRELSVSGQLEWATKFYGTYKGRIGTVASFYVSTFLPALLPHADETGFVLCASTGPFAFAYNGNKGFDTDKKGWITPGDLVDATVRATGPRTNELIARVAAAKLAIADTDPPPGT